MAVLDLKAARPAASEILFFLCVSVMAVDKEDVS